MSKRGDKRFSSENYAENECQRKRACKYEVSYEGDRKHTKEMIETRTTEFEDLETDAGWAFDFQYTL